MELCKTKESCRPDVRQFSELYVNPVQSSTISNTLRPKLLVPQGFSDGVSEARFTAPFEWDQKLVGRAPSNTRPHASRVVIPCFIISIHRL